MTTLLTPPEIVDDVRRRDFLGILAAAGLLAGCGADDPPAGGDAAPGYPRTVRHAGGELEIRERPARVVVAGPYSELDVLLALGVQPAGVGSTVDPLRSWQVAAGAEEVPTFAVGEGPDLESLAVLRPDLTVMNGTTYASYPEWVEQYGQLCPVLGMPDGMEQQLALVAEALGLPEEVQRRAADGVEAAVAGFAPGRIPESIVCANYFGDGQVLLWTPKSPHSALMRRLGLPDLSAPAAPADDPDSQFVTISLEQLELLEVDLLLMAQASDGDPAVDELEATPAFANLAVVREGRYVRQSVEETFAVGDVTVLSLPVAIAGLERALA